MSRFDQLKSLIGAAEDDFQKFYEKGNQAAGTRVRNKMQEIKSLAQEIRKEIIEKKSLKA
jgi:hypothetical protein